MLGEDLEKLIQIVSKFPALGPKSARKIALHLLKNQQTLLPQFIQSLQDVFGTYKACSVCHYWDSSDPCCLCRSTIRQPHVLCVVKDTGDVWALEKAAFFKGKYHVLGGLISAFHGQSAKDLNIDSLKRRIDQGIREVIMALDTHLEGQTTMHYVSQELRAYCPDLKISSLARGIPVGGELDSLDQGTLVSAFLGRQHVHRLEDGYQKWVEPLTHTS